MDLRRRKMFKKFRLAIECGRIRIMNIFYLIIFILSGFFYGGWIGGIIAITIPSLIFIHIFLKEKIPHVINKHKKCIHGIRGAYNNSYKCEECKRTREENQKAFMLEQERRKFEQKKEKERQYKEWISKIRLPEFLKQMHPKDFERLCCNLFYKMGYQAISTKYSGDHGIDGILKKNGETIILQCKRVKGSVGEPILRDLYGAMHDIKANSAIIITTGKVSNQARKWANEKPLKIIELPELTALIKLNYDENEIISDNFVLPPYIKKYIDL